MRYCWACDGVSCNATSKIITGYLASIHSKLYCCIVGDYVQIPDEFKVSDIIVITNNYASELTSRIKNNANKKIKDLSTGEKRLLEIYYVLSQKPKIIILDEITNGLDVNIKDTIMDIINEIKNNILVIIKKY